MSEEPLDELRKLLVALEDTSVWCQELMDLAHRFILASRDGARPADDEIAKALDRIANARRYLEADRADVMRLRKRVGLD